MGHNPFRENLDIDRFQFQRSYNTIEIVSLSPKTTGWLLKHDLVWLQHSHEFVKEERTAEVHQTMMFTGDFYALRRTFTLRKSLLTS